MASPCLSQYQAQLFTLTPSCLQHSYHLGDSNTTTLSQHCEVQPQPLLDHSFCVLTSGKHFPEHFTSMMLVSQSQPISQLQLTSLNCPVNTMVLLLRFWYFVNHSRFFSPISQNNRFCQEMAQESLCLPPEAPEARSPKSALNIFILEAPKEHLAEHSAINVFSSPKLQSPSASSPKQHGQAIPHYPSTSLSQFGLLLLP